MPPKRLGTTALVKACSQWHRSDEEQRISEEQRCFLNQWKQTEMLLGILQIFCQNERL